jgi:hypothetical protein
MGKLGTPMPENKRGHGSESQDLLLRFLDCAVIQAVHEFNREMGHKPYDSVRDMCD